MGRVGREELALEVEDLRWCASGGGRVMGRVRVSRSGRRLLAGRGGFKWRRSDVDALLRRRAIVANVSERADIERRLVLHRLVCTVRSVRHLTSVI